MRIHRTSRAGLCAVAVLTVFMACSEAPTSVGGDNRAVPAAAFDKVAKKPKLSLHYARVRGDGTLVDGTAVSAAKLSTGRYLIVFSPPIDTCAASANSTSFQGFDGSVFRITAQISIGFTSNGAPSDTDVVVSLFNTSDGSSEDTSFTLILACP
jgi:hypothetical protein